MSIKHNEHHKLICLVTIRYKLDSEGSLPIGTMSSFRVVGLFGFRVAEGLVMRLIAGGLVMRLIAGPTRSSAAGSAGTEGGGTDASDASAVTNGSALVVIVVRGGGCDRAASAVAASTRKDIISMTRDVFDAMAATTTAVWRASG
jgi:hypothetical protein